VKFIQGMPESEWREKMGKDAEPPEPEAYQEADASVLASRIFRPRPVPASEMEQPERVPFKRKAVTVLISLEDAVATLCYLVSNYALERFSRHRDLAPRLQTKIAAPNTALLKYNHGPFMHALLADIFSNNLALTEHPSSTKVLIAEGVDEASAVQITSQVFQMVVDSIGVNAPGISFGNPENFDASLCDEFDLMLSIFPAEENSDRA
jgi:hypothetical protein